MLRARGYEVDYAAAMMAGGDKVTMLRCLYMTKQSELKKKTHVRKKRDGEKERTERRCDWPCWTKTNNKQFT